MRRTPKENINQSFINLIRKAHGLIENSDIEKQMCIRDSHQAVIPDEELWKDDWGAEAFR